MPAIELQSEEQLKSLGTGVIVCDFWAEWSKPCAQLNTIFDQLADSYPNLKFVKIEAEKVSDVTEKYEVSAVPYFLFLKDGKVIDKVEGANSSELASKVAKYNETKQEEGEKAAQPKLDLNTKLSKLINTAPVMLFMKGTPEAPQCGFSRKIVEILKQNNVQFSSFNILADEEVRQGLKTYSNWPTYPQLYSKGKLIGGLDIVRELSEGGELLDALQ